MRSGLPAIIFIASIALTGCNHFEQTKAVRPAMRIDSIVSLSPSTTEIIGSSTVSMLLKGRTASDNFPLSVEKVPIVASLKPDYEAIKAINPNLIVMDSHLYNGSDLSKIKSLGVPVFEVSANNIPDFENQLFELSDMIGAQTNTSDYVDRIQVALSTAEAAKPTKPVKVSVIMPGHGGAPMICGSQSFIGSIVAAEGGTMVGPAVDRFVPLNPEMLTTENPDLIILPTSKGTAAADVNSLLGDPTLKGTKAIQTKSIVALEADVALREGARVDKLVTNVYKAMLTGVKS
jgi:iron complex transport system substrate-binding protein